MPQILSWRRFLLPISCISSKSLSELTFCSCATQYKWLILWSLLGLYNDLIESIHIKPFYIWNHRGLFSALWVPFSTWLSSHLFGEPWNTFTSYGVLTNWPHGSTHCRALMIKRSCIAVMTLLSQGWGFCRNVSLMYNG